MRITALLVVLALAMAGCSNSDDSPPDGPDEPGGPSNPGQPGGPTTPTEPAQPITEIRMLSDFDLTGCSHIRYNWFGNPESVNALLPEGYTAATILGQAQATVELGQCADFSAAGSNFPDVWFGRVAAFVEPPAAFPNLTADDHQYILTMLAGEDILGVLWPAAGYDTRNGSVLWDSPIPQTWNVALGGFQLTSAHPAPPTGLAAQSFAWYHETTTGDTLAWTGNYTVGTVTAGTGTLQTPDDSPFAQLAATPRDVGATEWVDEGAYDGMNLVLHLAEPR